MLKIGIVGLGTISYIHQVAIKESEVGQLVAVCDTNENTHKDYADYHFYTDLNTMLTQEKLDIVHVCLPHDLHAWATRVCLEHGVHVFVEKPLADTYAEGLALVDFVEQQDYKVGVCFQNRYNKTTIKLKELLEDPQTGKIQAIKGLVVWFRPETYYEAQPWRGQLDRAGGGATINQSIHTLDLMQYMAGKVVSGKGQLLDLLNYDIEVEDSAVGRYIFESDAEGIYFATNAYANNSSVELEVVTDKTTFTIKDNRLYQHLADNEIVCLEEDDRIESLKSYYGQGHKLCVRYFYEAIINDTEDYIHVDDAVESLAMIEILRQSTQQNRMITKEELKSGKS